MPLLPLLSLPPLKLYQHCTPFPSFLDPHHSGSAGRILSATSKMILTRSVIKIWRKGSVLLNVGSHFYYEKVPSLSPLVKRTFPVSSFSAHLQLSFLSASCPSYNRVQEGILGVSASPCPGAFQLPDVILYIIYTLYLYHLRSLQ